MTLYIAGRLTYIHWEDFFLGSVVNACMSLLGMNGHFSFRIFAMFVGEGGAVSM